MGKILRLAAGATALLVFHGVGSNSFVLRGQHDPSKPTGSRIATSALNQAERVVAAAETTSELLLGDKDVSHQTSVGTTASDIRCLTFQAIDLLGHPIAYAALSELGHRSQGRHTFQSSPSGVIQALPFRLPCVDAICSEASELIDRGWMSTNADSVDGIPSYHVNIVSDGKCLFENEREPDDFQCIIRSMYETLKPFLYKDLEPYVQEQLGDDRVIVSDVFLRHYGPEKRTSLSAHYDVTSYATVVMALDDSAKTGSNGLYTVLETSNHAALRKYFPLGSGDGVLHTWNVLHGVQIDPNVREGTSLIVWFSTTEELEAKSSVASWLFEQKSPLLSDDDGVQEFVQASAIESADSEQLHLDDVFELYIKSAARRNSFALCRLGSLCEQANTRTESQRAKLSQILVSEFDAFLMESKCTDVEELVGTVRQFALDTKKSALDSSSRPIELAKQLWLAASLHGNGMAQMALADQLMYESTSSPERSFENRLLATTLFVLAAQQGLEEAEHALYRILDMEASEGQEGFESSPIVLTASVFLMSKGEIEE